MEKFIARYEQNGIKKSVIFDKLLFDQVKAEKWLDDNGIKNFLFFFEPEPPQQMGDNGMLFKGEVGFDITMDSLMPYILDNKTIILDTFGGDSWEGLKIYDFIKGLGTNPSIGVLGTCASAGMQILLASENRWITSHSRGLIHNPWTFTAGDDEMFRKTAKELEDEKLNIANIYTAVSGKSLDEILSLMKEERILNSKEMKALNFAQIREWNNNKESVKVDETPKTVNPLTTDNDMTENEVKQLNGIEKILNNIKNKLFPPKNLVLQDVNGVELDFGEEVETKEQIQIGATATAAGEPANGEYVLNDGTVFVFESGNLTEIKEPEMEAETETEVTVDELQEEVNNLTNVNSDLQNKLDASNAKIAGLEEDGNKIKNGLIAELEKVQTEFAEFKNGFSDDKPELNAPAANENAGELKPKFSYKKSKN